MTIADIDNPDALRKYYDLLLFVLRVIVSAVFVRGFHNEQMVEQTRAFLAENRQSMVGIFKRFAKIGGASAPDHHETLSELAKSYMALVAATDFLEVGSYADIAHLSILTNLIQFEDHEVMEQPRPSMFS